MRVLAERFRPRNEPNRLPQARNAAHVWYRNPRLWLLSCFWVYGLATASELFPIFLTLPTLILILWQVSRIRDPGFVSLDIFWFCSLIFFVVGPCQAINNMTFENYGPTRSVYRLQDFLIAEGIVVLFFGTFAICESIFNRTKYLVAVRRTNVQLALWQVPILLLVTMATFVSYVVFSGGIGNVLATRRDKVVEDISFLAYISLGLMTTSAVLIAAILVDARARHSLAQRIVVAGQLFAAFVLLGIAVNPFNSYRFGIVGVWGPIAMTLLGRRMRYVWIYFVLFFGVVAVMPLMSLSTRRGLAGVESFEDSNYSLNLTQLKDVDVFDTLVHSVGLVEQQGYYWGANTEAICLFFVPRALWPGKPVVGGLIVGEDLNANVRSAGTANLSFFVGGDLYMDFGFAGVVGGAMICALLWLLYEKYMSSFAHSDVPNYMLVGSIPILLRGPVGAVIGFFFCLFCGQLLYKYLFTFTEAVFARQSRA